MAQLLDMHRTSINTERTDRVCTARRTKARRCWPLEHVIYQFYMTLIPTMAPVSRDDALSRSRTSGPAKKDDASFFTLISSPQSVEGKLYLYVANRLHQQAQVYASSKDEERALAAEALSRLPPTAVLTTVAMSVPYCQRATRRGTTAICARQIFNMRSQQRKRTLHD